MKKQTTKNPATKTEKQTDKNQSPHVVRTWTGFKS